MANSKPVGGANDGFVSSSKGITLSVVSLIIWTFTLLLFRMTDVIAKGKISYETFCLFTSFILSVITGIYISRLIYRRTDKWRLLAMFLNILLIYSSANGIQAGYAAVEKAETKDAGKTVTKLALFGLLDARPWLTDATSREKIKDLSADNDHLQIENKGLLGQVSELQTAMKANDQSGLVKSLTEANQQLHNENNDLKSRVETLQNQLRSNDQGALVQQLQNENRDLANRLTRLQAAIAKYNSIRSQWTDKVKTDVKFRTFVSKFREGITPYLGAGYLDQLFNYDLNPK